MSSWNRAMDDLVRRTDSRFAMVATLDSQRRGFDGTGFYGSIDGRLQNAFDDYTSELYCRDPSIRFCLANPRARHVATPQVMGGGDYSDDEYYRWSVNALGSANWQLSYSAPVDGLLFGVALHTGPDRAGHDRPEAQLFHLLFDHMEQAARLAARPLDLQSIREARVLLDSRGTVLAASPAAEAILTGNDGIMVVGKALCCGKVADQARVDALLRSAASVRFEGGSGGTARVARPSGRRDWIVVVSPVPQPPGPFAAFRPCVQVRIVDPEAHVDDRVRWREAFGVTAAEARLIEALLASDCNLRRAADRCGVTYATARAQLASVFRKTETGSQPQLVRLLTLTDG